MNVVKMFGHVWFLTVCLVVPSGTWAFSLFIRILLFVLACPAEGTGTIFSIVYDEEVGTHGADWAALPSHTFYHQQAEMFYQLHRPEVAAIAASV